jgi:uncharacterized protein
MASINNDEQGCFGAMSGHERKTLRLAVDADPRPGRVVVTGSQNLLLSAAVSQGLAGRAGFKEPLPLSYAEGCAAFDALSLDEPLQRGAYPAIHRHGVAAAAWHASCVASGLERDVPTSAASATFCSSSASCG